MPTTYKISKNLLTHKENNGYKHGFDDINYLNYVLSTKTRQVFHKFQITVKQDIRKSRVFLICTQYIIPLIIDADLAEDYREDCPRVLVRRRCRRPRRRRSHHDPSRSPAIHQFC